MAALPYMQFYVADYLADTMHLEAEEHGAYLLLLMNYWQTGEAIPKSRLQRIARVTCNERWASVQQALSEFFDDNGTHWFHHRVERDLDSVMEIQRQRVAAGKASAEARKRVKNEEKQSRFNGRSTSVEVSLNEKATNREEIQIRSEEIEKTCAKAPGKQATGSRLPADWTLPADWKAWAAAERPDIDPARESLVFRDYWVAQPGAKGRKTDWLATWRNWIRRANASKGSSAPAERQYRDLN